jgi:hypothetical protein
MKKTIKLTESDLNRLVTKVINESSKEEDMNGKKCESCGKGVYKETEPMDDMRGTLHCSKCDKMVDRYKEPTPFKKKGKKKYEFIDEHPDYKEFKTKIDELKKMMRNFEKNFEDGEEYVREFVIGELY